MSNYGDKEITTNLLVTLKHMKSEFNIFTQEASNQELYEIIDGIYQCISTIQRDVYDMMSAQGWYQLRADTKQNIKKAYDKFSKSQSEMC